MKIRCIFYLWVYLNLFFMDFCYGCLPISHIKDILTILPMHQLYLMSQQYSDLPYLDISTNRKQE